MDTNQTTTLGPIGLEPQQYFSYIISLVEGVLMVSGNGLIVLTVLLHKQMRQKEMLLLVGMALADGFYGIGRLSGGIRRLNIAIGGSAKQLQSSWECLVKFPTIFYLTGSQATALMMTMISFDRFMAVKYFEKYIGFTTQYYMKFLYMLGGFSVGTSVLAIVSCYLDPESHVKKWSTICLSTWAVPRWYAIGYTLFTMVGGLLSVIIYAGVYLSHRSHLKTSSVVPESNTQAIQARRQRRMTITIGLITICTFIFHSIPYTLIVAMVVAKLNNGFTAFFSPYAWGTVCVNSIATIFVLLWRHENFRKAAWNVLRCRKPQVAAATVAQRSNMRSVNQG